MCKRVEPLNTEKVLLEVYRDKPKEKTSLVKQGTWVGEKETSGTEGDV